MVRNFMLILFVMIVTVFPIASATAEQIDCTPLDPRVSVSNEWTGKINATVNALFKIAKIGSGSGSANIEGRVKNEIQNLQKGIPISEQGQIKLRTLYLACGMIANAKDILTERKVELFKIMMHEKADRSNEKRTTQKKVQTISTKSKSVAPNNDEIKVTEPQNIQQNPQSNVSITSQEQTGGITAQTVTINNNAFPLKDQNWNEYYEELERQRSRNDGNALVTRTFWLTREPGATLSLGPCPGEKCFEFELKELKVSEGTLVQTIKIKGNCLGVKKTLTESTLTYELNNDFIIKGVARVMYSIVDNSLAVEMRLHRDSTFEMFGPQANIKFTVIDVLSDSLRIKLEVGPPDKTSLSPDFQRK